MNTPTFKEQFDKITRAYFENNLDPLNPCACFIGNILNGNDRWTMARDLTVIDWVNNWVGTPAYSKANLELGVHTILKESNGLYTVDEIIQLENNFLQIALKNSSAIPTALCNKRLFDEDQLFKAMDSTLDMLRKIHESKGEVTDNYEFKKRQICVPV